MDVIEKAERIIGRCNVGLNQADNEVIDVMEETKGRVELLEHLYRHYFTPKDDNDSFCKHCDFYITDNLHIRANQ